MTVNLLFNSFQLSTIHRLLKVETQKSPIPQIYKQFINFNSTDFNLFNEKIKKNKIFHISQKFNNSLMWMIFWLDTGKNSLSKHFHSPNNNNNNIILILSYLISDITDRINHAFNVRCTRTFYILYKPEVSNEIYLQ